MTQPIRQWWLVKSMLSSMALYSDHRRAQRDTKFMTHRIRNICVCSFYFDGNKKGFKNKQSKAFCRRKCFTGFPCRWLRLQSSHRSLSMEITFIHLHFFSEMYDVLVQRGGRSFLLMTVFNYIIIIFAIRFPICWGAEIKWICTSIKVPLSFAAWHGKYFDGRLGNATRQLSSPNVVVFYFSEENATLAFFQWSARSKNNFTCGRENVFSTGFFQREEGRRTKEVVRLPFLLLKNWNSPCGRKENFGQFEHRATTVRSMRIMNVVSKTSHNNYSLRKTTAG